MNRVGTIIVVLGCALGGFWVSTQYHSGNSESGELSGPTVAAPAFRLADTRGQYRELAEWRGKVVVVNFWATWCAPCLQEIPDFVRIQAAYADRGVQFVGIALDAPDAVMRFAQDLGITYPVLLGTGDAIEVARQFGNTLGVLPYTAVIDQQGRLADVHAGVVQAEDLTSLLDDLVAATPVSGALESG